MRFYDQKTNKFYNEQDAENTRQEYDDIYFANVFDRAKKGEIIDVNDLQVPDYLDRETLQKSLHYAAYMAAMDAGDELDPEIRAMLEAELFAQPEQTEQGEDDE